MAAPTHIEAVADRPARIRASRLRRNKPAGVDPTTGEIDYDDEQVAFMRAMDDYRTRSGRKFPTYCEILKVVKGLGYEKPRPLDPDVWHCGPSWGLVDLAD